MPLAAHTAKPISIIQFSLLLPSILFTNYNFFVCDNEALQKDKLQTKELCVTLNVTQTYICGWLNK
jgi:hypothetical protein